MKSLSVTIQMKATELYFPVVLFIMLYKLILTFESAVDEILKHDYSSESYWAILSSDAINTLPKVILTFDCFYEFLKCTQSSGS